MAVFALAKALKATGIPAELHMYDAGGHGFGMRKSEFPCHTWPARCGEWMGRRGLLKVVRLVWGHVTTQRMWRKNRWVPSWLDQRALHRTRFWGPVQRDNPSSQSYKEGENVEVFYLGSWLPGVVVKANSRGEVLVEFSFATRPRREVFKADAVRAEYESGAIARGRIWSDPSGSFKVKASLLSTTDDEVTLRKQDMAEIRVAVSKLSEGDKAYLKKLQKSMGLAGQRWPEPPPPEALAPAAISAAGHRSVPRLVE